MCSSSLLGLLAERFRVPGAVGGVGGVPDGADLGHHLRGRGVGELGPNVEEAMEPATDPHRMWEH